MIPLTFFFFSFLSRRRRTTKIVFARLCSLCLSSRPLSLFSFVSLSTMADDDDFAFDFEGNLQKEAETYQGASVSRLLFFSCQRSENSMLFFLTEHRSLLSRFSLSLQPTQHTTGRPRRTRPARRSGNAARAVAHKLQEELPTGEENLNQFFFLFLHFFQPRPLSLSTSSLIHTHSLTKNPAPTLQTTTQIKNRKKRRSAPTGSRASA